MYPLGLLFGLGFDTATEIALLATAGTAAAGDLPLYAILCLPILFAAGMCLFDTVDGAFMNFAYGWAFLRPVRKVFYNLTITAISVLVALVIGPITLLAVLSEKFAIDGGPIGAIGALNLEHVGFLIVGLFALCWAAAVAVWRFGQPRGTLDGAARALGARRELGQQAAARRHDPELLGARLDLGGLERGDRLRALLAHQLGELPPRRRDRADAAAVAEVRGAAELSRASLDRLDGELAERALGAVRVDGRREQLLSLHRGSPHRGRRSGSG